MFRVYWPKDKLAAVLAEAEARGETKLVFHTLSDATRFRFACYNHRRKHKSPNRLSFSLDAITDYPAYSILVRRTHEPIGKELQT